MTRVPAMTRFRPTSALLLALAMSLPVAAARAEGPASPESLAALQARLDVLTQKGEEAAPDALPAIEALALSPAGASPAGQRSVLRAAGQVLAFRGNDTDAAQKIRALQALGRGDVLVDADVHLVQSVIEDNAGRSEASYEQARAALRGYSAACTPGPQQRADCDYRSWWAALEGAVLGAIGQGNVVVAGNYVQAMLDLSRRYEDRRLETLTVGAQAFLAERNGNTAEANRYMAQAYRLAQQVGSPRLQVLTTLIDGSIHRFRQQPEISERMYEDMLKVARSAHLPREEGRLLVNLSDIYVHRGQPARALESIDRALPIIRLYNNLNSERVLLHNATLAHLALGRVGEAKAEMAHVLDLWQRDTGPGERMEALREFGEALAQAGDTAGAIELFHKEQALQKEIRATNKSSAEQEMKARFDQNAQKRRIELMARDNDLKSAELANQQLSRRLWMLAGVGMAMLAVLAVLMYRRVREMNRTLVQHEALLKAHSERDALTGLANRRQFREVMRVRGADRSFNGALLMVDVDHFKRINDRHGHASGDKVLIEMSRRLMQAMRGDDLVARWGGEEFLVFAPGVEGDELDQLADRVRRAIAETPMALENGDTLDVTVSIGYASFPLPNSHVPVTWEQAVNLADLSLYTAKNHGRNRSVGIVRTTAGTRDALREVANDLALAHQEGRVELKVTPDTPPGPAPIAPAGDAKTVDA
jgi:diguanylate cyclase (GGDEF)-like protein